MKSATAEDHQQVMHIESRILSPRRKIVVTCDKLCFIQYSLCTRSQQFLFLEYQNSHLEKISFWLMLHPGITTLCSTIDMSKADKICMMVLMAKSRHCIVA